MTIDYEKLEILKGEREQIERELTRPMPEPMRVRLERRLLWNEIMRNAMRRLINDVIAVEGVM